MAREIDDLSSRYDEPSCRHQRGLTAPPTGIDETQDPTQARLDKLQKAINARRRDLNTTSERISKHARTLLLISTTAKVSLVLLGAISATKAAADQFFGSGSNGNLLF